MNQLTCAIHGCPIIDIGDGRAVCWVERAQQLLGHQIVDIAIDDGVVVWIFENYKTIFLVGWKGNKRACQEKEADALLDVMQGGTLLEATWNREKNQGYLEVGNAKLKGKIIEPWWGINLRDDANGMNREIIS